MADGIDIEAFNIPSGFDDVNLENVFYGGSVGEVLGKFGQQLKGDLKNSLDSKGKNTARNSLYQSITFNIELFANTFQFSLSMNDYWRWVDEGRKPGKRPPIKPLIDWVYNKQQFGFSGTPEEAKQTAFNIAKKIGKFGVKPSNFFSDVINDGRLEKLEQDLATAAQNDITSIIFKT